MNTLIIDTSTSLSILSLTINNKTFSLIEDAGTRHSITMFDSLSALLLKSNASINDVELIATGTGPGSFTGVRVAVSTSRMFAQILRIPLIGINSQDLFAAAPSEDEFTHKLVAFDARKGRVFGALYRSGGEIPERIIGPGDYTVDEISDYIGEGFNIELIGDGCGKYSDELKKRIEEKNSSCRFSGNFSPCGKSMFKLVYRKYSENPDLYRNYNSTIPDYARKSDAETALEQKNRKI